MVTVRVTMKNLIQLLGALILTSALFVVSTGCTTPSSGSTSGGTSTNKVITPDRVYKITKLASYAAAVSQAKNLKNIENLVKARNGFCDLKAQEKWDIESLSIIASQSGLGDMSSSEGQLALVGVPLLIDSFYNTDVDLRKVEYAEAVVKGSCEGLTLALPTSVRSSTDSDLILKKLQKDAKDTR